MLKGGFKRLRTTLKGNNKELDELNGLLDGIGGVINNYNLWLIDSENNFNYNSK